MSGATTLKMISSGIAILNGLISMTAESEKYRALVSNAVSEGRDVSEDELDSIRDDALDAIEQAKQD